MSSLKKSGYYVCKHANKTQLYFTDPLYWFCNKTIEGKLLAFRVTLARGENLHKLVIMSKLIKKLQCQPVVCAIACVYFKECHLSGVCVRKVIT